MPQESKAGSCLSFRAHLTVVLTIGCSCLPCKPAGEQDPLATIQEKKRDLAYRESEKCTGVMTDKPAAADWQRCPSFGDDMTLNCQCRQFGCLFWPRPCSGQSRHQFPKPLGWFCLLTHTDHYCHRHLPSDDRPPTRDRPPARTIT